MKTEERRELVITLNNTEVDELEYVLNDFIDSRDSSQIVNPIITDLLAEIKCFNYNPAN